MSNITEFKQKTFWERPEGKTGGFFMLAALLGGGYLLYQALPTIIGLLANTLYATALGVALFAVIYMVLDPRMRNLVWYSYKSIMRWITGIFVTIDPIGILKNYISDLEGNLAKMSTQIGNLRGQMRKLEGMMTQNTKDIDQSVKVATVAKAQGNDSQIVLNTRKAGRLQEANAKYQALLNRMDVLYKILTKMYENSEILLEDTKDQVNVKEQEYKAIAASHSAMKSAMSIMSGDPDKRALFEAAMENITDDVAGKVGEMERFMDLSKSWMDGVDLQNGVFEEEGLKMLEKLEKDSKLILSGGNIKTDTLDLNSKQALPQAQPKAAPRTDDNSYDGLFK
jgi:phage shock protein A